MGADVAPIDEAGTAAQVADVPSWLLTTKLYVPDAPLHCVRRVRLLERLDAGLQRRLTLLVAPAGYGKTSLVADWRAARPQLASRLAWLSLDSADNDPQRFLGGLVASVQTLDAAFGRGLLAALNSPEPLPLPAARTALVNQAAQLAHHVVLVLDDYHVIEAPAVHETVNFLLEHQPPQMHLILTSRQDPPLALGRLRARDQLVEVRAADLRFDVAETGRFLHTQLADALSAADVAALEARTEGWIAALQLAVLAMRHETRPAAFVRSFDGSHRYVIDYLAEEVLAGQPPAVRSFLLETSILTQLNAALCDAVTDRHDSREMLLGLADADLFLTPLDRARHWYRYHHLFREFLSDRLAEAAPDRVPVLHRRAYAWYAAHGRTDEAIQHALRAGAFHEAATLVLDQAEPRLHRGEFGPLRGWLHALPQEVRDRYPSLGILHAWTSIAGAEFRQAHADLSRIAPTLPETPEANPAAALVRGQWHAVYAYAVRFWAGDYLASAEHAHRALDLLPPDADFWRGLARLNLGFVYILTGEVRSGRRFFADLVDEMWGGDNFYAMMVALAFLGQAETLMGRLSQAADTYHRALTLAGSYHAEQWPLVAYVHYGLAVLYLEWNRLDEAEAALRIASAMGDAAGNIEVQVNTDLLSVSLCLARGDVAAAEDAVARLAERIERTRLRSLMDAPAAFRAWLALYRQDWDPVRRWLRGRDVARILASGEGLSLSRGPVREGSLWMLITRALLALDRPEDALRVVQLVRPQAQDAGRLRDSAHLFALEALALYQMGRQDDALGALTRALALAEPEGYVRTFVDEGAAMAALLRRWWREAPRDARGRATAYVERLLAEFPAAALPAAEAAVPPAASGLPLALLVEPLTDRERDVLALMAEGLTNPEIADRLYVSLSTVKSHAKHIYGKLSVGNRTEAAARARELGLL